MVSLVRLITGEELLAEMNIMEDGGVTLKKPQRILAQPSPNGQLQVGLAPVTPFGQKDVDIIVADEHILFAIPASTEMESIYKRTVSNLILPTKPGTISLS